MNKLFDGFTNIPFPSPRNPQFTFVDLFAGVGGFRLALQSVGGKCVFSSEWNNAAMVTYSKNFGDIPCGDITLKETKDAIPNTFDVLCAGFPCQAFSIAGKQKGFEDTRGTLIYDVFEIVNKHRPKVIFLENVKNLVAHDKGRTFTIIREKIENVLGYKMFYKVLNSMTHASVPQNRERIFIVAFNPDKVENYHSFSFPEPIPLKRSIKDLLLEGRQEKKLYYNDHAYYPLLAQEITRKDTIYQWRRVYVRENKSKVCPTLTANMGAGGHNVPLVLDDYGIRKLTPRECFRFQGYPDSYILPELANSKLYMQAGNSVTVPLITRIAEQIFKVL